MPISINVEKKQKAFLIRFKGKLDAISSPVVEESVNKYIESQGEKFIAFDFDHVEYISSAGLRLLLSTMKKLKDSQGKFAIFNVHEDVLEAISLAGFNHIINIYDNEKEVVEELSK